MPPPSELVSCALATAARQELDPRLVCAVIEQESAWDTFAIRFEPAFLARYVSPLGLSATEEIARSTSWGLMQVMGQVARENGFVGKSLVELSLPELGLEIGCTVLARKIALAEGDNAKALALWNGGANQGYAADVLGKIRNYSGLSQ
jgi:soluble lytic murein transglycosylase-like protein